MSDMIGCSVVEVPSYMINTPDRIEALRETMLEEFGLGASSIELNFKKANVMQDESAWTEILSAVNERYPVAEYPIYVRSNPPKVYFMIVGILNNLKR